MNTLLLLIAVLIVWLIGAWLLLGPLLGHGLRKLLRNIVLALIWSGICAGAGISIALSPLFL